MNEDVLREFLERYAPTLAIALGVIWIVISLGLLTVTRSLHEAAIYFYLAIFPVSFSPYLLREILQKRQLKRFHRERFRENKFGEHWKEPQFVRDLTDWEKRRLAELSLLGKQLYLFPLRTISITLGLIVIVALLTAGIYAASEGAPTGSTFWFALVALGAIMISIIFKEYGKEKEIYRDLHLPVRQVCGRLVKQEDRNSKDSNPRELVVRGVSFTDKYNPMDRLWELREGREYIVEYSPTTKKIWRVKGVTDEAEEITLL